MTTIAIIVAGGKGKRMGRPKQFIAIAGRPMLWRTIAAFEKATMVDGIIVVVNRTDIPKVKRFEFDKIRAVVAGGKERQDSVYHGLQSLPPDCGLVAIHDGARPLINPHIINLAIKEAARHGAVVVGVPVKDTIKQVGRDLNVLRTLERSELWAAQTPQVFRKDLLLKAFKKGYNKCQVTDDAMLVEKMGGRAKMVMGSHDNIKVTTAEDLAVAGQFFKRRGV